MVIWKKQNSRSSHTTNWPLHWACRPSRKVPCYSSFSLSFLILLLFSLAFSLPSPLQSLSLSLSLSILLSLSFVLVLFLFLVLFLVLLLFLFFLSFSLYPSLSLPRSFSTFISSLPQAPHQTLGGGESTFILPCLPTMAVTGGGGLSCPP